ncbi:MAG TPA: RING finger protein [Pirellulaceae bacterium]|nr:RING finger protein [Pirellulaceae bacterium]HMO92293.1 RING finger protein [Pirellulaceae bacterium]HMP71010.1 RING finger protein [Pirellulaceae bacterium]
MGNWSQSIEEAAERYGGSFHAGGLFTKPSLQFPYVEQMCLLRFRSGFWNRVRGNLTEFSTSWPFNRKLSLSVLPIGRPVPFSHWGQLQDVDVADSEFQAKFAVKGFPTSVAQRLVNAQVRWQLEELGRLASLKEPQHAEIAIWYGWLVIAKQGHLRQKDDIAEFLRLSLGIVDQFKLTMAEGIKFADGESTTLLDNVYCPICSEEIVDQMVVCMRCKTPHCRDCWDYNSQCAMFACGEKRFINASEKQAN